MKYFKNGSTKKAKIKWNNFKYISNDNKSKRTKSLGINKYY